MHYIHLCMKQAGLPMSSMSSSATGILIIIIPSVILWNKNKSMGILISYPEIVSIPWASPAILPSWGCVISWGENKDLNASFSNELCNNTPIQTFTQTEPIRFYTFCNIFKINETLSVFKCAGLKRRHRCAHNASVYLFVVSVCYDK